MLRKVFLTVAALAGCLSMQAQDSITVSPLQYPEQRNIKAAIKNTRFIMEGESARNAERDSMESLVAQFYMDQYRHFQDPRAPYFMFLSRNGNWGLGLGGVIRMRGWYDWDGSIPTNGFVPYFINIPKDPTSQHRLAATPAGTAFHMTVLGHHTPLGNIAGYIQAGFNGYNNIDFKLKKAYLIIGDWTMGYATATFVDPASQPPTIDGAGPNGFSDRTNVLVRYFHTFKHRWSVGAGVEIPKTEINADNTNTKACSDWLPDLAALGQYQWNGGASHVRLAGLLRFLSYRDLLTQTNHTIVGWGAQLSTVIKIIPNLTFYGQASVGQGHGSYLAGLSVDKFDLVADADHPGELYAPTSVGTTLGLRYFFRDNIYSCLALGQMSYHPRNHIDNTQYKYGQYAAVNVFYDITPRFSVGGEYLYGKRKNFDGSSGHAQRVDAFFQLSF